MELVGRKRAFLPKVKTGCLTCKSRKVKCDELKPQCRRCTSTGRTCSGYRPTYTPTPVIGQQVEQSISTWLESDPEKRSFDFFVTHAGQHLSGFFNAPFWSREVLQAAICYPAIRHLIVALGAAYEQFECQEPEISDAGDMRFALKQCNSSIRSLARSTPQSAEDMCCILTASVLFAIFAILQTHVAEAIGHVRSGMRVLHKIESLETNCAFPVPIARLRSMLTNLYAQVRGIINDEAQADWDGHDPLVSEIKPVAYFLDIADAHSYVESLYNNTLAFYQRTELSPPVTLEQTDAIRAQHHMLCCALRSSCDALNATVANGVHEGAEKAIAILRLHHTSLSVRLSTNVFLEDQRETFFDDLEQQMVQMLDYCRLILQNEDDGNDESTHHLIYSSGLGAVMPLHMIAARCRNPLVRQEALEMLLRARRREGFWDSTLTEKIVSTTIELEQKGGSLDYEMADCKSVQRVPDNARIREVKIHFEGERRARLDFITVGQWKNNERGYQRCIQW